MDEDLERIKKAGPAGCTTSLELSTFVNLIQVFSSIKQVELFEDNKETTVVTLPDGIKKLFKLLSKAFQHFTEIGYLSDRHIVILSELLKLSADFTGNKWGILVKDSLDSLTRIMNGNDQIPLECVSTVRLEQLSHIF